MKNMASVETKSWSSPDGSMTPDKTHAATINFGGVTLTKANMQPGWKWSDCVKPHVGGDSCQAPHVGVVMQGSMTCKHDDGTEIVVTAGDAYSFAPGHDGWVEGDEEAVLYEFNNTGKTYAVWEQA